MLRNIVCKIFNHRIHRRRVWNDGLDYRTTCGRCGKSMVRDPGGWREYDPERDNDSRRLPHPREREE